MAAAAGEARIDVEHGLGRERMGRGRRAAGRLNLGKRERRRRILAGVEEERRLGAVEIERMLDLQLKVLDRRHVRPAGARHAIEQQRPEAVVAARVIAPAEDDQPQVLAQPLRARETSAPSASTRSTSSGI